MNSGTTLISKGDEMPDMRPKIIQTNFRTSAELRDALILKAEAKGVSLNREINDRLQQSLVPTPSIERVFFSRELYAIAQLVASAMNEAGKFAAMVSTRSPNAAADWLN